MKTRYLLIAAGLLFAGWGHSQIISTIAGGNNGNTDSAKTFAMCPKSVISDSAGNLYIGDGCHGLVLKLSASGIITTIAGNSTSGYAGDGGPATAAEIGLPAALAVDDSGNVYISDDSYNRIRKVSKFTGIISTVAGNGTSGFSGDGGQATAAEISLCEGIAVDKQGNLYIADEYNNRIRKVTKATGIINTIAGNGTGSFFGNNIAATSAELYYPRCLAVDDTGNVYIADENNSAVRKIDTAGKIHTLAGNGSSGYSGDGGPATSSQLAFPTGVAVTDSGVFIADAGTSRIRRINTSGIITTLSGNGTQGYTGDGGLATSAELSYPVQVTLDGTNNIYIADANNNVIRQINISKIISTIAGNSTKSFSGDGKTATASELYQPLSVTSTKSGTIYIADYLNQRVRMIKSGIITTIAGNGTAGYTGDGGPASAAELNNPFSVAADDSGNIYIADEGNARIRKIDKSGIISTYAGNGTIGFAGDGGPATAAWFKFITGVATDDSGNVYIVDENNERIREVTKTTGIINTIAGTGTASYNGDGIAATSADLDRPYGVAVDHAGNVYISDEYNSSVRMVTKSTGLISTFAPGISYPSGLTVDGSGNVFVADYNSNVYKVTPAGMKFTIAGNGTKGYNGDGIVATTAELNNASGLSLDTAGNLLIADTYNGRIRMVTRQPLPVAGFIASATSICVGTSITFTDTSSNTPVAWNWSFAGGSPSASTSQNQTVLYSTAGTYAVKLAVTNTGGTDSVTRTSYITVNPLPTISVTGTDTIVAGTNDTLKASGATSYVWTSGSTADTAIVSPSVNTTYTVTGTTSGCSNTATFTVTIKVITAMNSLSLANSVQVYPNPGNGVFNIQLADGHQLIANSFIEIYNVLGERIYTSSLSAPRTTLSLTGQPAGMYFYKIISNEGKVTGEGKLVIE